MTDFRDADWFESLKQTANVVSYKLGENFSAQGEKLDMVGIVLSGKATAISFSINGDETWLGEFREGQFIGLLSLLSQDVLNYDVRAVKKMTVLTVSHTKVLELMRVDTGFCQAVATDLSIQLRSTLSDLINLNTLSVKGRICAELLRLSLPIGIEPDKHVIRPSPVFTELARRLNSSRETVSRTISELQNKGVVTREPGALIIQKPESLRGLVDII